MDHSFCQYVLAPCMCQALLHALAIQLWVKHTASLHPCFREFTFYSNKIKHKMCHMNTWYVTWGLSILNQVVTRRPHWSAVWVGTTQKEVRCPEQRWHRKGEHSRGENSKCPGVGSRLGMLEGWWEDSATGKASVSAGGEGEEIGKMELSELELGQLYKPF